MEYDAAKNRVDRKLNGIGVQDSPAIQNLIAQLNRELEETKQF